MDLILNIGNSFLSGALFKKGKMERTFHISSRPLDPEKLLDHLNREKIEVALIGSDQEGAERVARRVLDALEIPHSKITHEHLSIQLDVEVPQEVGIDRIANTYGALALFPGKDAIVVDLGTAVTFDVVLKERKFIGGAIYPGPKISAEALHHWTDKLPLVEVKKPNSPISRSTIGNIQSGIYYGLIGAVETMTQEMKKKHPQAIAIATGGLARPGSPFLEDLKNFHFQPELTLLGSYEILKERNL